MIARNGGITGRTPGAAVAALQRASRLPVGAMPGTLGGAAPPSPQTGARPLPPDTASIGGEPYLGRPADTGISMTPNAAGTGLDQAAPGPKVFGAGTIPGADGSSWTPLRQPGAAVAALRSAGRYRPDAQASMANASADASAAEDTRRRRQFEDEDRARANAPMDQSSVPAPPAAPPAFPRIPPPGMEDTSSAENTAFGRAHGRIGQLARGSLMATSDAFNARGLGGSRSEGRAIQGVISDAANQNADVIAQQAAENLHRQEAVNDRNYSGEIGQRGADMGYATTTRGQDIGYESDRAGARGRLDALRRAGRYGRY